MKLTRKAKLPILLGPIGVLACVGAAVFFGYFQGQSAQEEIASRLTPGLQALDQGELAVRQYAALADRELAVRLLHHTEPSLTLPAAESPADPEAFIQALPPALVPEAQMAELKTTVDNLVSAVKSFKNALRNAPAPEENPEATPANRRNGPQNRPTAQEELRQQLNAALASANLGELQRSALAAIGKARSTLKTALETERAKVAQGPLLAAAAAGGALVLSLLCAVWALAALRSGVEGPINRLLARMRTRQNIVAEPNEAGEVATYLNKIHAEALQTEQILNQFSKGAYLDEFADDKLNERLAAAFLELRTRFKLLDAAIRERELEAKGLNASIEDLRLKLKQTEEEAKAALENQRKGGIGAELDLEGTFVFATESFLTTTGYTFDKLQHAPLALTLGATESQQAELKLAVSQAASGTVWSGLVECRTGKAQRATLALALAPVRGEAGRIDRLSLTALDVTALVHEATRLQQQIADTEAKVQAALAEAAATRLSLDELNQERTRLLAEKASLKANIENQRQLEYRMVQQQAALHELARNNALKDGSVKTAMRTVTETVVYALDDERVGIWLFALNGERIRCVDMYERTALMHSDGFELICKEIEPFGALIRDPQVFAIPDAYADERTRALSEVYLEGFNTGAILTAPIKLGGSTVGIIMLEHTGKHRNWTLDEQNFLLAIGDLVSLALEQGNRKAMEEELRMTLEESQALEEELRQNAEEIEATNEEMRRTQIELRGQINALNNSAIVSETNLQGIITYANVEFAKVYGHSPRKVIGQNHRLLKSGEHSDHFYEQMWKTIASGNVWKGEIRNRTAEGNFCWVSLNITPVLGLDGKPYKYIGVGFDITQQKRQEDQVKAALSVALQQEEALRSSSQELVSANEEMRRTQIELAGQINALNNSALVYETDLDGNIIYVNDRLTYVSGFGPEELMGHHYTVLKSGRQDDRLFQEQWKTILNGRVWHGELEFRKKDGGFFWAMATNTPVIDENGDPIKSINVLVDVTEQKVQEFRLKKQAAAMMELTQNPALKDGNVEEAFALIARIGYETLGVSRVSVWLNEQNDTKVRCLAVTQTGHHPHDKGAVLDRSLYPAYFRALDRDRIVASNNPLEDDRTKELGFSLLKPENITAVLDIGIRYGAKTVGVLSIEQKNANRMWQVDEISFATSLADAVATVLEQKQRQQTDKLKLTLQQLEEANHEMMRQKMELEETTVHMTESIKYAKRIQNNILPDKTVLKRELGNYFIVFRPKDIVGGDFYWFSSVDEDRRVIIVADGTGHGVPGAFLTLIGYLLLNQVVNEKRITRPDEILYHLHIGVRQALKQDEEESTSRDGMDVACCTINMRTLECLYAGANLPFYYYQDWEIHEVRPSKKSIGGEQLEEERTYELNTIQLKPGDAIYMYTDGFVDQMGGPEEKRFSKKRFRDLILRTQHESMKTQRALLNLEWKDWKDDREQLDDVTVFGLKL